MFILPDLLYLNVLPLFRRYLYHFILLYLINTILHKLVGRLSPRWSSPGLASFLGRPGLGKSSYPLPTEVGRTMFILPALLYLNVLPLFGQCLYHCIVPSKSRPPQLVGRLSPRSSSPGLTSFLSRPGSVWVFLHHTSGRAFGRDGFNVHQARLHGGSSVESGFKPVTLRPEVETIPPGHRGPWA
ncbi:hypothetical protein AVEN_141153-1 [Araneus ventricosus]|uniref:Uncharacterized protein n=1 Tax=Araneus ventricosus TaxID=182803 RepID=A0A4Y2KQ92_ARAVE|nr:hypothetical protein AVEN_141153-1 [Araneus ventricosus]